jgi:hypothetical protein
MKSIAFGFKTSFYVESPAESKNNKAEKFHMDIQAAK